MALKTLTTIKKNPSAVVVPAPAIHASASDLAAHALAEAKDALAEAVEAVEAAEAAQKE